MSRSPRIGRAARLGVLAGSETAKHAAVRGANLMRSDAQGRAALIKRNEQFANRLVTVLGTMRGAAMKVGQMLSLMDAGLIPADQRDAFQRKLASLQSRGLAVPWPSMSDHLQRELGQPLEAAFMEFDPTPVASASIGQVYRARLHDGQHVAVKAQYPGIEAAVHADIKNLRLLFSLYRSVNADLDLLGDELESRVGDELDYRIEADNTRVLSEAYRGHPFIRIPHVVDALSRRRVIVTEWLDGQPLEHAYTADEAERNRVAEIVFRFYSASSYTLQLCNGDPHPGNCLLREDGSIAFLDFGLLKKVSPQSADIELAAARAALDDDGPRLAAILDAAGALHGRHRSARRTLDFYLATAGWYLRQGEFEVTNDIVNEIVTVGVAQLMSPTTAHQRHTLPAEHMVRMRAEAQTAAILAHLRAHLDLRSIAREWLCGSDPVTELGRRHEAWERSASAPGQARS